MIVTNWTFARVTEGASLHLFGNVEGHPNIPDGKAIRTSPVEGVFEFEVHTVYSLYTLSGPPCENFEAWYTENDFAWGCEQYIPE